jgi:phytoene dehydrogenase-like protein
MAGSVEAFGLDVFNGARRPTAWLAGSAHHSGLPPSTAGSGAFGFLLQLLGHSHGWPYPAGGQGQITRALLSIAAREGVTVRCQSRVERILVRAGRVVGLEVSGGEQLPARDVVSTISARPLAAILPEQALPDRLLRRLRIWRYGTAAFKLDFALRAPVPWTAPEAREATSCM